MKKIWLIVLAMLITVSLCAVIDKHHSSMDGVTLTNLTQDYQIIDIYPQGQSFQKIITAGIESLAPGAPDLPTAAAWIAIPPGKEIRLQVSSLNSERLHIPLLAPVPYPAAEIKGAGGPQYSIDQKIYGNNELFPGKLAGLEKESLYRGINCAVVRFYPYQYNPVTGELIIHTRIELDISFTGSEASLPKRFYNPQMQDFLNNNMINGSEITADIQLSDDRPGSRESGSELLVVCPDIFFEAAEQLANWKAQRGVSTQVVTTSQTGQTSFSIAAWIRDYCDNHDPVPQSILLFGDAEFIPPWYVHEFPGEGLMATDVYYADLEIEFDFLLDFSFGRIPVDTVEDAQRNVDNIICYEQTPPADPAFYQKAVIAGAFQDGEGEPPDTYANRRFAKTSEDIRNFLFEQGYNTQRIYTEYNGYNNQEIFPTYWNQYTYVFENDIAGGELEFELQKPQFPWNGSQADVSSALNSGCFLLTHRDHGGRNGWGEPDFNSNDVVNLQNGELLPVVWSVNCLTGYFDNETDSGGAGTGFTSECFTEYWFRNSGGGAIGVVGSTRISFSGNNDRFVWGMMDALYPGFLEWCGAEYPANNAVYRMGEVVNYAKTYLSLNCTFDDYLIISFEEFEWFGDPTLEIRLQQPMELNVSHPDYLEYGQTQLSIDAGLPGAVCTLWDGSSITAEAVSGLDNIAMLDIAEYDFVEELNLTVWYTQSLPYSAVINVVPPQAGFLQLVDLVIDDSSANGNGQADFGETISLGLELINIGQEAISNFALSLVTNNEFIEIMNNTCQYNGTVNPQEYVAIPAAFALSIADNCPDAEHAVLQFAQELNQFDSVLELHAPVLHSGYFTIDDSEENNNQAADPGEEVIIELEVMNLGSISAQNVSVMLLSYDPWLSISPAEIIIDELPNSAFLQFTGTVSENAQIGADYDLQSFVNSGAYSLDRLMSGIYGYAVEDFESGDFSLYNWEMSGDYGWGIDTDAASGMYSARTDMMSINSTAQLSLEGFLAEEGVISFYRKLYANTNIPGNNGGILTFYIDDEPAGNWGGNSPWQFVQFEVPAGPHEFVWEFEKDNDPTTGTDGAWIDRIEFPSMSEPPPPLMQIDQQVVNIELPAGGSAEAGFSIANAGAGTLEYLVFFQNDERDLGNSNISLNAYDYTPGETAGWLIELHNNGFDQEAITDLYITFPQQANLNIATPLNGGSGGSMVPDGSSGSGITLNWHGETEDGSGVLLPGESALGAVNVTMAADAPLSIILSVEILGDLGSNIFQEVELGNLSCGYITLDHNHGELAYAETSEILLDINAQNLSEGFYTQNLRILDHLGSEVVLPVQINVTASNEDDNQIQYITALNHIYPNPFNPSTSINFCLSETQFVKISIFNIKGQKVVELANSLFEAGYHTLTWQPDNSPSGVYLLNFSSADYNQSQKIILMK